MRVRENKIKWFPEGDKLCVSGFNYRQTVDSFVCYMDRFNYRQPVDSLLHYI